MKGRGAKSRGVRGAAALGVVLTLVFSAGALAAAATPTKAKPTSKQLPTLATLKIQQAKVSIAHKGKKFAIAKNGQVLRQGDSLRTDAAGKAEIDYTDGSLTRLGPSTVFTITKLTNKRGGRQTQGTLDVGQTWNRAAKVSETGSFEVKAGGTTAAVEGTAFAFVCAVQGSGKVCTIIDVVDNVKVTTPDGTTVIMLPATSVEEINDLLGKLILLSYQDLLNNPFIVQNLGLDQLLNKGNGLGDLPPPPTSTTPTTSPGGTGSGGGTGAGGGTPQNGPTGGSEPGGSEPPSGSLGLQPPTGSGGSPLPSGLTGSEGGLPPVFSLPPLAQQCLGSGYLSLVGADGTTFASEAACILFVLNGGTFATGIVIPAGQVVTFEDASFDACNELRWGYQLNLGANVLLGHQDNQCGGGGGGHEDGIGTNSVDAGDDITIGPFPTAVLVRVFLIDVTCDDTFYSDQNHAVVTGTGPWQVDIADAGGSCEAPPSIPRLPVPLPPAGHGNLTVTVHLGPPDVDP